jgi:tetratricopeptide (TPR) repeat protein
MSYSVREVAAMLGLRPAQIRSWATKGFLDPEHGLRGELRFGFRDLIVLRTAGELSAANIAPRKVRRVLEKLRKQLPEGRSLTAVRIAADGERVVVRDGDSVWNPDSGQALFDFSVADVAAQTAPFARRAAAEARDRGGSMSAEAWFELGFELEVSSVEEAEDAYGRAIALAPEHADAHVNLGRLLHERRDLAAAADHYRKALSIDPEHSVAAFNLGVALEDLGRIRDAMAAYERAIALDPNNADAHYNLAGLYEKRGDKAGAVRHLKAYRALASSESQ